MIDTVVKRQINKEHCYHEMAGFGLVMLIMRIFKYK